MNHFKKIRRVFVIVLFVLTLPFVNGCVMTERARSDLEWQQMNPNYRSPVEPDPRAQWGLFGVPHL
jgi:hypothetical protein